MYRVVSINISDIVAIGTRQKSILNLYWRLHEHTGIKLVS